MGLAFFFFFFLALINGDFILNVSVYCSSLVCVGVTAFVKKKICISYLLLIPVFLYSIMTFLHFSFSSTHVLFGCR